MWMKKLISIHAPPRGATARASSRQQKRQHFNSRPSARGDTAGRERRTADRISIHAPPRGATRVAGHRKVSNQISIHAPPRGATTRPKGAAARNCPISIHAPPRGATRRTSPPSRNALFQFTPLREGRHQLDSRPAPSAISIHAPPRGATAVVVICAWISLFQFTPLREGRRRTLESLEAADLFQFTPLREGRPRSPGKTRRAPLFQFTPLREGRPVPRPAQSGGAISIHAPPRGATSITSG